MTGRWIYNRGALLSPCDAAGCKRFIEKGEWYFRCEVGAFCRECADRHGVTRQADMVATVKG